MTATLKLKWTPIERFPGEYECVFGNFRFVVNEIGCWDICVRKEKGYRWHIINNGDAKNITAAKRKCQQWLDRQWKAMCELMEDGR